MPPPSPDGPVLIISDGSACFMHALRQRFPQVTFQAVGEPERVEQAIASLQPLVVMSCKSPAMPGPVHRPAVVAPSVKWVQVAGAGFDHLQPVQREDLVLTNSAGVLSQFMAETVLGAILMLNLGLPAYVHQQRHRRWQPRPWSGIAGKSVLILGLGNIGRRVAAHCRHMGMHVTGLRRGTAIVDEVHELVPATALHDALGRCDVLCVHVPLTHETANLVGSREFAAMKRGVLIVNTSRGGVMDEQALLAALTQGTVAAAHLDVFAQEPLPAGSPLWDAPNLLITPHVADSVADYEVRFAEFFADNLERWLQGRELLNVVDPGAGY